MKKIHFILMLGLAAISVYSQSGAKWATNGNTVATGEFLGTINLEPLPIFTNGTSHSIFNTDGSFQVFGLSGLTNRLLMAAPNGSLITLPAGGANQILNGNLQWVNASSLLPQNFWQVNGNSVYYNYGTVGIGTNNPSSLYKLDVIGDARISNNLYVGGGIVITDKVQASSEVKTSRVEADTIKMDATKAIYGETRVEGDLRAKYKLEVTGDANFNGQLMSTQGFLFDGQHGMKYTPASGGNSAVYKYGGLNPIVTPTQCVLPYGAALHQFNDVIQVYETQNGQYPANGSILNIQSYQGGSSIDASAGSVVTGISGLALNYYCGSNTMINTGPNGGWVYLGNDVNMRKHVEIGDAQWGTGSDPSNIALEIRENNGKALVFKTYNNALPAISIDNPNISTSPFTVYGNGRTRIGADIIPGSSALLEVNGASSLRLYGNADGDIESSNSLRLYFNQGKDFSVYEGVVGAASQRFTIQNGNFGFDNPTPYKKLTVNGDVSFANYNSTGTGNLSDGFSALEILGNNQVPTRRGISLDSDPNGNFNFWINSYQTPSGFYFKNGANNSTLMSIFSNGQTCINCDNPGSFMLAVNGKLGAREIKVTMVNPWPDYVFEKDYVLPSLNEVKDYIAKYGHLKGIPSAEEVKKDEYGLNIAEMQGMQMEKIEEIFLYLIEMKKEVDQLKKENDALKIKVEELQNQ